MIDAYESSPHDPTGTLLSIEDTLGFDDIIPLHQAEKLKALLTQLTGMDFLWLRQPDQCPDTWVCSPVTHDLEPIIWLAAPTTPAAIRTAIEVVQQIANANIRYLLVSTLHRTVVQSDYDTLLEKHANLQASEERYRELSTQLEEKVSAQVKTVELTQRRLYEAEKLSAVGQLAAGVAHEINNPIGFVSSNLHVAQDYLKKIIEFRELLPEWNAPFSLWKTMGLDNDVEDFSSLLCESESGIKRVARIVSDLKDFSHLDRSGATPIKIDEIIRSIINVSSTLLDNVRIDLHLQALPAIQGDSARLTQALHTIILNAVQAMPDAIGTLLIEASLVNNEEGIIVRFSDNGSGISPENISHVFEPFFTTKPVGSGTGLGLTVARDVIRAMGGDIEITSTPLSGTDVTVRIPLMHGIGAIAL